MIENEVGEIDMAAEHSKEVNLALWSESKFRRLPSDKKSILHPPLA